VWPAVSALTAWRADSAGECQLLNIWSYWSWELNLVFFARICDCLFFPKWTQRNAISVLGRRAGVAKEDDNGFLCHPGPSQKIESNQHIPEAVRNVLDDLQQIGMPVMLRSSAIQDHTTCEWQLCALGPPSSQGSLSSSTSSSSALVRTQPFEPWTIAPFDDLPESTESVAALELLIPSGPPLIGLGEVRFLSDGDKLWLGNAAHGGIVVPWPNGKV